MVLNAINHSGALSNDVNRDLGYSSHDIISTMFKVTKTIPTLSEHTKLEFIREIGFTHMRILDGVQSLLQVNPVTFQ